jgi:hypothetical protein
MKTRLGALIVLVAVMGVWGCGGSSNTVTGPAPPDPSITPNPAVTPVFLAPTPTPNCRNFKQCQDQ